MDWLDLLAVQGTLKSLLQHHSSKASILWCAAFLIVQRVSAHCLNHLQVRLQILSWDSPLLRSERTPGYVDVLIKGRMCVGFMLRKHPRWDEK